MALPGFECSRFRHDGEERDVYRRDPSNGPGPAVVVIHEVPGITPAVRRFGERLVEEGYSVFLPHLFGTPDEPEGPFNTGRALLRACILHEFRVLARRGASPITEWLRALCRHAHAACGGPGVGVVGMCLTGNFGLALMADPSVMAPVLSQPSLPFGVTPSHRAALHVSDAALDTARCRIRDEGLRVLALRFTGDWMCPPERFERLRGELGDGVETIEIDSSAKNLHGIARTAHSVLTRDFVDEDGHPTRAALDRVLALFEAQLRRAPSEAAG